MDASILARIEFRQVIGAFTDKERTALIDQMIMAAQRIRDKKWENIDVAEFSAPEGTSRLIVFE